METKNINLILLITISFLAYRIFYGSKNMNNIQNFENSSNKPYLWQYWDNIDGRETPAYINLCFKTVDRKCSKSFQIVRLDKDNISKYLPEVNDYKELLTNLIVAHKVDIYRIMLLFKYGGIYLDADTICLRDPIEIIDKTKIK